MHSNRTRYHGTGIVTLLTCCGLSVSTTSVAAQIGMYLPLEIQHGPILDRSEITPFTLSISTVPALGFGEAQRVRLGPVGALTYVNPEWVLTGGAQISYRVLPVAIATLPGAGVDLALRGRAGGGRQLVGAVALFDLDGFLRVGLSAERDVENDETLLGAIIGTDLLAVAGVPHLLGGGPMSTRDPPPISTFYDVVRVTARGFAQARAPELAEETDALTRLSPVPGTVALLREEMFSLGAPTLAGSIEPIISRSRTRATADDIPIPEILEEARVTAALVDGWKAVLAR